MNSQKNRFIREIALKLQGIRQHFGYSRQEMADALKISIGAYNKNENGINFPCFNSLYLLSQNHGISMDWLLFNKGTMDYKKNETHLKELENKVELLKTETEKSKDEKVPGITPEIKELLAWPDVLELLNFMKAEPKLYYKVMLFFQEYKKEHREKK
jgi:transcriptional regulator with XRE-family HTH domain